jgi:hypothetical protein
VVPTKVRGAVVSCSPERKKVMGWQRSDSGCFGRKQVASDLREKEEPWRSAPASVQREASGRRHSDLRTRERER